MTEIIAVNVCLYVNEASIASSLIEKLIFSSFESVIYWSAICKDGKMLAYFPL